MVPGGGLFRSKSRFLLSRADGDIRVFRDRGERCVPNCGGSITVWTGIHHDGRMGIKLWWKCHGVDRNPSWW